MQEEEARKKEEEARQKAEDLRQKEEELRQKEESRLERLRREREEEQRAKELQNKIIEQEIDDAADLAGKTQIIIIIIISADNIWFLYHQNHHYQDVFILCWMKPSFINFRFMVQNYQLPNASESNPSLESSLTGIKMLSRNQRLYETKGQTL